MIALSAARRAVGQDLTPEAVERFVAKDPAPLARLLTARAEILDAWSGPLIPPLGPGEIRPLVGDRRPFSSLHDTEATLNSLWGALLYSHSAAAIDPLGSLPWAVERAQEADGGGRDSDRGRSYALEVLHFLAAAAPLVDSGTLVLVPRDRLPRVELDFGHLLASMQGLRAALIENYQYDGEFHPETPARSYMHTLEQLAATGWSVHIAPLSAYGQPETFALRALLRQGRRRLWRHNLKRISLRPFDAFAIDTLTRVPVTDLSDLDSREIQLIRDEDAFGAWRAELSAVIAEYRRNVGAAVPDAARIATERLQRRAEDIDGSIDHSPVLSAARAGLSTFGVAGSAVLATFPVLSASARVEGISLAVGSSLVAAGQRVVFHQRERGRAALLAAQRQHYRGASAIFRARAQRRGAATKR